MRDPNRIPDVLRALGLLWQKYPDLRLGQLLLNFDVAYYTEDDVVLALLEEALDNSRQV